MNRLELQRERSIGGEDAEEHLYPVLDLLHPPKASSSAFHPGPFIPALFGSEWMGRMYTIHGSEAMYTSEVVPRSPTLLQRRHENMHVRWVYLGI